MLWRQRLGEHLAKGAYLGLAVSTALWADSYRNVMVFAVASIAPALLGVVLLLALRPEGRRGLRRSFLARWILGVVDQSRFVYAAVLAGSVTAALVTSSAPLLTVAAGLLGCLFGAAIYLLHRVRRRVRRRWLSILGIALVVALLAGLSSAGLFPELKLPGATALSLGMSAVTFYLLAFAGQSEESEFDIAIVCLGLCLALASLELPRTVRSIVLLLPIALYVVYCERIRKNLVIFKHVIRGMEQERAGQLPAALVSYRLALQADPKSELAAAGNWRVHQRVDLQALSPDHAIFDMIDPDLCLDRARSLIAKADDANVRAEATKLIEIVEYRNPDRRFAALSVGLDLALAAGEVDAARQIAVRAVGQTPQELAAISVEEVTALMRVWSLLWRDPALLGTASELFEKEGQALAFVAVLEEQRRRQPTHELAADFRPFVYRKLRLVDMDRAIDAGDRHLEHVDGKYALQVARELAAEEASTSNAVELFQIAERLLPTERLTIWMELGRCAMGSDPMAARGWIERVFEEGAGAAQGTISESAQEAVYESARILAQDADRAGNDDRAILCWEVYSKSPKSGTRTRRILTDLHTRRGDGLSALRHVQSALAYSLPEKESRVWRQQRDQLYSELSPATVQSRAQEAAAFFDIPYCLRKATRLYDDKAPAPDILHYIDLVTSITSDRLLDVNYLLGRLHLREGKVEDAAACFHAVCQNRPTRFRDADQEKSWFRACRTLGELLVERLDRPEEAIKFLAIYKDHIDSGADTLFLLAKAHENAGNAAQARKWYDMVLVYPSHARASAAKEALARLGPK